MEGLAKEAQFGQIMHRLDMMQKSWENQAKDLKSEMGQLKMSIVGNKEFGQDGMVQRIQNLEKAENEGKALRNKIIGIGMAATALWAVVVEFVKVKFFQ